VVSTIVDDPKTLQGIIVLAILILFGSGAGVRIIKKIVLARIE